MWYTIYDNINKAEFESLKNKIENIVNDVYSFMEAHNFTLNQAASYKEYLGVDFLFDSGQYAGSIGFVYDEEKTNEPNRLFKFYILKSYDTDTERFFKKIFLEERYSLDTIQAEGPSLLDECIKKFNLITKKEMVDKVQKSKL